MCWVWGRHGERCGGVCESVGERCGKVCWGVVKVRGDEKSVGGVKCWVRRGKVRWDVRKVREGTGTCEEVLGKGVEKCVSMWERERGCGEVLGEV